MSTETKAYRQDRPCPKCHSGAVTTLFSPDESAYTRVLRRHAGMQFPPPPPEGWQPEPRMVRDCINCKHTWQELPLDIAGARP